MTLWSLVPQDRNKEPDYVANAESVADLNAAMRPYPGSLGFLSAAEPQFIAESLARLDRHPTLIGAADLDRARREWHILEPFEIGKTTAVSTLVPVIRRRCAPPCPLAPGPARATRAPVRQTGLL
ncbi:hypothetical protein ACIG56_03045 [Nocardia fusca]|uniref:hypothetical protein n=1 Tax=Nocardia fusca TaxID=941183 RepID=UPI0037C51C0B